MILSEVKKDATYTGVSPACAGMIPDIGKHRAIKYCEPRMRGDDPYQQAADKAAGK